MTGFDMLQGQPRGAANIVDAILAEILGRQSSSWVTRTRLRVKGEMPDITQDIARDLEDMPRIIRETGKMPDGVTRRAQRETEIAVEEILADAREVEVRRTDVDSPIERTLDLGIQLTETFERDPSALEVLCTALAMLAMDKVRSEPAALVDAVAIALADYADRIDETPCACGMCATGAEWLLGLQAGTYSWPEQTLSI